MPTRPDDDLLDDDPFDLPETGSGADAGLADLLDPDRWPDDEGDDDLPLPRESTASVPLQPVGPDDELDGDDPAFERLITEEAPLPGLADEPAVVNWRTRALVDGVSTPTLAMPSVPISHLRVPEGRGHARVRIRLAGRAFEADVVVSDGPAELVLGRDLLAGRFLVGCDDG